MVLAARVAIEIKSPMVGIILASCRSSRVDGYPQPVAVGSDIDVMFSPMPSETNESQSEGKALQGETPAWSLSDRRRV